MHNFWQKTLIIYWIKLQKLNGVFLYIYIPISEELSVAIVVPHRKCIANAKLVESGWAFHREYIDLKIAQMFLSHWFWGILGYFETPAPRLDENSCLAGLDISVLNNQLFLKIRLGHGYPKIKSR